MFFRLGYKALHQVADVIDIKSGAMEGAIGRDSAQHLADGADSAFARGVCALDHKGRRTHAHNQAVPAAVEGECGLFHHFVGSCRSRSQKASAHPSHEVVGGDIVRRDDDYPAAPPGANPVFRQSDPLRSARAGGVDLRIRTPGTDELGKLRMSHRQNSEQEAPVEEIRLCFEGGTQLVDAPAYLFSEAICSRRPEAQLFQRGQLLTAALVRVITGRLIGERVAARESGGKNHTGIVAQSLRQPPPLRQLGTFAGGFIVHGQRDAGVM